MNNRHSLLVELIIVGTLLLLAESVASLVILFFKMQKDLSFLIVKTFLPVVSVLFAIYLSKRWKIRLSFKFDEYFFRKFILVISATVIYFIVIFPVSFPIIFAKNIFEGRIQTLAINHSALSNDYSFLLLINSVIVAPIVEEILFRGLIHCRLKRYFSHKTSLILSSLIFAISHYNPSRIVRTFLFGLLFGSVYDRSGSLIFSIIAHSLINLFVFFTSRTIASSPSEMSFILIVYSACILLFFLLIKKKELILPVKE